MRDGMKTRGRKLVQDGERPGVWTTRGNADQRHPQRNVNVPPPDGLTYRHGPPAAHSIGARIDITWTMQSDTHTINGTPTQQPYPVLRRMRLPPVFCWLNYDALVVATSGSVDPGTDGAFFGRYFGERFFGRGYFG